MHESMRPILAAVGLTLPALTGAHHSYTMFDMDKSVTLAGTVKEVQWTNPHIWLQLMVKDPDSGKEVEWSIEGASPNMLARAGWTRHALNPGDKATVVLHPVKSGGKGYSGSLAELTVGGKRLLGGQNAAPGGDAK